jgi:hypothetical protein
MAISSYPERLAIRIHFPSATSTVGALTSLSSSSPMSGLRLWCGKSPLAQPLTMGVGGARLSLSEPI